MVETDVLARWRKEGWVPPSEQPETQKKWKEVQDSHWPVREQQPKEQND